MHYVVHTPVDDDEEKDNNNNEIIVYAITLITVKLQCSMLRITVVNKMV